METFGHMVPSSILRSDQSVKLVGRLLSAAFNSMSFWPAMVFTWATLFSTMT